MRFLSGLCPHWRSTYRHGLLSLCSQSLSFKKVALPLSLSLFVPPRSLGGRNGRVEGSNRQVWVSSHQLRSCAPHSPHSEMTLQFSFSTKTSAPVAVCHSYSKPNNNNNKNPHKKSCSALHTCNSESGSYLCYFIDLKKDGGLILNLISLNHTLMKLRNCSECYHSSKSSSKCAQVIGFSRWIWKMFISPPIMSTPAPELQCWL